MPLTAPGRAGPAGARCPRRARRCPHPRKGRAAGTEPRRRGATLGKSRDGPESFSGHRPQINVVGFFFFLRLITSCYRAVKWKDVFAITTIFLMSCKQLVPKLVLQTEKASLCLQATQRAAYFDSETLFIFHLRPIARVFIPNEKKTQDYLFPTLSFIFISLARNPALGAINTSIRANLREAESDPISK